MRRLSFAAVAACLLAHVLLAQQPAPSAPGSPPVTFRAEVNYVEVDAFVTDGQGQLVIDLTQNEFEIRIHVEAQSRVGQQPKVSRDIQINVN